MSQVVNVHNVQDIEYMALVDLMHDVYAKDLPAIDVDKPIDLNELERLSVFFANQYSYVIELWAKMAHQVRFLKRTSQNKDSIDEAVDKRDYLEKIMSATKLKYYCASRLLKAVHESP